VPATVVLRGLGDGTFAPAVTYPVIGSLAVADVDRDGHLDLVVGDVVLRNQGDGSFVVPQAASASAVAAIADFDNGGFVDAVTFDGGMTATASFHPGLGDVTFGAAAQTLALAAGSDVFAPADVDGDGLVDVVLGDGTNVAALRRTPTGFVATAATP